MRVYDKGKHVPMEEVTWKLLCQSTTYTDFDLDTEVEWPEEIQAQRCQAVRRAFKHLNMEAEL
ncbi:hypothetical protein KAR91_65465 [Candidatus Pacearchaeota archaeon]|nr:hypothetical protein [Candidatus Pacearchaeota archaeon]